MTQRNIALCIVLTLVTCGLYGIYWIASINDQINWLANRRNAPSGLTVILLSVITLGIYWLYWNYKMGDVADWLRQQRNYYSTGSLRVLCLVLSCFSLGIVSLAFLQDEINHHATM